MRPNTWLWSGAALAAASFSAPLKAQQPPSSSETATVVADSSFRAGWLHRWLFGTRYRELWAAPLQVPVLDLDRFAGGLTPTRRGGGLQTTSLRFRGGDGREYQFRSIRKHPGFLPEDLRGTFVESVARDQLSAMHPGGSLAMPPILAAGGVLHAPPSLALMPDHPRLGEHRADFAGLLGTIEERPTGDSDDHPGFAGAERVVDTERLYRELLARPDVGVDTRAFLTARLLDLFVGDWDRHEDQWRWALLGQSGHAAWYPIPRDRDQAFALHDGLLLGMARWFAPRLLKFGESYADPAAATFNGRYLDRRILTDLDWRVWDSVATTLQGRLSDSVIAAAVNRMPEPYRTAQGEALDRILRVRRDRLHEAARSYYGYLARKVDIHGGDREDWADIERQSGGRTLVRLGFSGRDDAYYTRTFLPGETREVRLYLHDGHDRVRSTGSGQGPLVRVIGGSGRDTVLSENGGRIKMYDHGENTVVSGAPQSSKRYIEPADTNPALYPGQDWGHFFLGLPRLVVNSDVGVAVGYGFFRQAYGFRRQPYANSHTVSLDYSFQRSDFRAETRSRWKVIQSDTYLTLDLLASGLEGLRFHGFGNGTPGEAPDDDLFRVRQKAYQAAPGIGFGLEGRTRLHLTARARLTFTDPDDETNAGGVIGQVQPPGYDEFGQLGVGALFEFDTRDYRLAPTRGVHFSAGGSFYPVTWGTDETGTFGSVEGQVSTYLTPVRPATFAFRVGGRRAFGDYPYFEAAYLGGLADLRGYPRNRFAGDGAVFGNAELRLRLGRANIILPGEVGLFGLADAGRVFFDGDPVKSWHTDAGGGLWFGFLDRTAVLSIGAAKGDEKGRFFLAAGMGF